MKGILIRGLSLGYVPVPKTACTSIKLTLYKLAFGTPYLAEGRLGGIHAFWHEHSEEISGAKFKFAVVRDPVKRFISAYANRVEFFGQLSQEYLARRGATARRDFPIDFVFNPSLNEFIDRFDHYRPIAAIRHHTLPQHELLSKRLEFFDQIFKFENISELEEELSSRAGSKVRFAKTQTGGRKYSVSDISKTNLERLIEEYRSDYDFLEGYYDVDQVWNEWKSGHS